MQNNHVSLLQQMCSLRIYYNPMKYWSYLNTIGFMIFLNYFKIDPMFRRKTLTFKINQNKQNIKILGCYKLNISFDGNRCQKYTKPKNCIKDRNLMLLLKFDPLLYRFYHWNQNFTEIFDFVNIFCRCEHNAAKTWWFI